MKKRSRRIAAFVGVMLLWVQHPATASANVQALAVSGGVIGTQDSKAQKKPPSDLVQYDRAPEVVSQVQPEYPNEALKKNLEGVVWVQLWVDESGSVVETKVMKSENPVFNQSAIDAARRWKFKPAIANDKPVAVWISVPFKFKLNAGGEAPSLGVPIDKPKADQSKSHTETQRPADFVDYDKPPEAVKQVGAKYPEKAKKEGLEGTVWVKVLIDENGKATKSEILKTDREVFNHEAQAAVMKWVFKPALKQGKPVPVWVTIPFRFKLSDKDLEKKK